MLHREESGFGLPVKSGHFNGRTQHRSPRDMYDSGFRIVPIHLKGANGFAVSAEEQVVSVGIPADPNATVIPGARRMRMSMVFCEFPSVTVSLRVVPRCMSSRGRTHFSFCIGA